MISIDFAQWRHELISSGNLPATEPPDKIEKKITRYWTLIDMVDGTENAHVFAAIVDSIQDEGTTEAYESTYNALWKFPPKQFAEFFVPLLPGLIDRVPEQAGRFLLGLAGWAVESHLPDFNHALAHASETTRTKILDYVQEMQGEGGWFEHVRVELVAPKNHAE